MTNMIDFDTGALVEFPMATQPGERDDARFDWINGQNVSDGKVPNKESNPWMRAHGVDAIEGNHDLIGLNLMLVARLESQDWSFLTPAGERKLRAPNLPDAATDTFNGLGTYGFKTREDRLGIIQITDTNIPRGVKLRYKQLVSDVNAAVPPHGSYRVAMLPKLQLAKSEAGLRKLKAKVVAQEGEVKAGTIDAAEWQATEDKAEALAAELKRFTAEWSKLEAVLTRHRAVQRECRPGACLLRSPAEARWQVADQRLWLPLPR